MTLTLITWRARCSNSNLHKRYAAMTSVQPHYSETSQHGMTVWLMLIRDKSIYRNIYPIYDSSLVVLQRSHTAYKHCPETLHNTGHSKERARAGQGLSKQEKKKREGGGGGVYILYFTSFKYCAHNYRL